MCAAILNRNSKVRNRKFFEFRDSNSLETALSHICLFLLCLGYSCARDMITSPQNIDELSTYFQIPKYAKKCLMAISSALR